jgi:hypothetical protein
MAGILAYEFRFQVANPAITDHRLATTTALCKCVRIKFLLRAALRAALNKNFGSISAQNAVITQINLQLRDSGGFAPHFPRLSARGNNLWRLIPSRIHQPSHHISLRVFSIEKYCFEQW